MLTSANFSDKVKEWFFSGSEMDLHDYLGLYYFEYLEIVEGRRTVEQIFELREHGYLRSS